MLPTVHMLRTVRDCRGATSRLRRRLPATSGSDVDDRGATFNFLERNEIAAADTRTAQSGAVPGLRALEIRSPKGPRSTLPRPRGIDPAASRRTIEERAISVCEFAKAHATSIESRVLQTNFTNAHPKMIGNRLQLVVIHPDDTRVSRTAVAALSTLKTQTVRVPRLEFVSHTSFGCEG